MEVDKKNFKKFKVIDLEVARADKVGVDGNSFRIKSHLGNILRVGDTVLGYDMAVMINNSSDDSHLGPYTPDVILVKKIYPEILKPGRKRVFQLERMKVDKKNDKEYDEFLDELEQDPELRANVNLYRNPDVAEEIKHEDETFPGIKLEEMIGRLTLEDNREN